MLTCPTCHRQLADDSQACPYCRTVFRAEPELPVVRTPSRFVRTPTRSKAMAAVAVASALGGGVGGFLCGLLLDSPAEFVVIFTLLGAGVGAIVGAATQMASEPDYFQRR